MKNKINCNNMPDTKVSVKNVFGIDDDFMVSAYKEKSEHVPKIDPTYVFDPETTIAICAGFEHNKRVFVNGYHGTGKSTHIEQIAARINWPCTRINLDNHVSRIDLIGKDVITVNENGQQITEFKDGLLPWAIKRNVALVFDEYDAARPDVMFVIQRVLERDGKLTLLDQSKIIEPHPAFRLFATANTVGLGDVSGLYHGTQQINQGQMDRWDIMVNLNYLEEEVETQIVQRKVKNMQNKKGKDIIIAMVRLANLTRNSMKNGDISTVMSPRTIIHWAENYIIFKDLEKAFRLTFLNKCDENEKEIIIEEYQRCFGTDVRHNVEKSPVKIAQ